MALLNPFKKFAALCTHACRVDSSRRRGAGTSAPYFLAALRAASMVASGSSRECGASSSGRAP